MGFITCTMKEEREEIQLIARCTHSRSWRMIVEEAFLAFPGKDARSRNNHKVFEYLQVRTGKASLCRFQPPNLLLSNQTREPIPPQR